MCKRKSFMIMAAVILLSLRGTAFADEKLPYKDKVFENVKFHSDIVYSEATDQSGKLNQLTLDVLQPEGDTATERPCILWLHGGNISFGDKNSDLTALMAQRFAQRGYVCVAINYRLNPNWEAEGSFNVSMRDVAEDTVNAIEWIKKNQAEYGLDANNIILAGYSTGAEVVDNLYYDKFLIADWDRSCISAVISLSGNRLFWADKANAGEEDTLCYVLHGSLDTYSPIKDIDIFKNQMGDRVILNILNGYGHLWSTTAEFSLLEEGINNFLYEHIATEPEAMPATGEKTAFGWIIRVGLIGCFVAMISFTIVEIAQGKKKTK